MIIEECEPGDSIPLIDDYDALGAFCILLFAAWRGARGWRYRRIKGGRPSPSEERTL
jgi:hypothetical protein